MRRFIGSGVRLARRHHVFGSLGLVVFSALVISGQIADRHGFANGALYDDVLERWGTPIDQPAPSVRYVRSGTVFTTLTPLALARQHVEVASTMNYRKRGLVYFSGFDFAFSGDYAVTNPEPYDIDAVFVFPVALNRNRVLLSKLSFTVNGEPAALGLEGEGDKLVWTGRLAAGASATFDVHFEGRGLDSFTYRLDPAMPVHDFALELAIRGGDNYDYPQGVVPARSVTQRGDAMRLAWSYPALESGVPVGALLPSEKSFDAIIGTMARRAWAPFLLFLAGLVVVAASLGKTLRIFETYLIAAAYGFFFVLLAYLAAFMSFYVAYVLSAVLIVTLVTVYARWLLSKRAALTTLGLLVGLLVVPTLAVIADRYTGLIYTLAIFVGLAGLMALTTRHPFNALVDALLADPEPEAPHVA